MFRCYYSVQITLAEVNPPYFTQIGSPYTSIYQIPVDFADFDLYSALAFAGYQIINSNFIQFQASLDYVVYSSARISLTINEALMIKILRFYLLIANANKDWIWIMSDTYNFINISQFGNGIEKEQTLIPSCFCTINNASDFRLYLFLSSFYVRALIGNPVSISLEVYFDVNNSAYALFSRDSFSQKIVWASYVAVLVNYTRIRELNYPFYDVQRELFTMPTSGPDYLFTDLGMNFGIPNIFLNSSLGGFQGNCALGMRKLSTGGFSSVHITRAALFSTLTDPISQISTVIPEQIYTDDGTVYFEYFTIGYTFLCIAVCPMGTFFNISNYDSCVSCPSLCWQCVNQTFCLSCANDSYYVGISSHLCQPCMNAISNCLNCDVSLLHYECFNCQSSYFVNVSGLCRSCSQEIQGCLDCTNSTYCSTCANDSFAFSQSQQSCVVCSELFTNCQFCTNDQCTFCFVGSIIEGMCTSIVGCTMPFYLMGGEEYCLACETPTFEPTPVNGVCKCQTGDLINGVCNTIEGCLAPQTAPDGSVSCLFCDITVKMKSTPDSNGNCVCEDKYELQNENCVDICGDGFLMTASGSTCDDGNLQDGDGCSADCRVENSYRCQNGSSSSPSACVYIGVPLTLSLKYIERSEGLNQGVFEFSIYPPLLNINRMDLSKYVSLSCDSTYTVSSMDYSSGTLTLTADYSEDMEARDCVLTIAYNSSIILSPNSTLSFSAISRTSPLILSTKLTFFANFKLIFFALSCASLVLFTVSLFHKLIGAQLLICCQLVYLSHCFYEVPSFLFTSIKSFNLVTGFWFIFYSKADRQLLFPFTDRVQITAFFINSSFIVVSILLCLALLMGALIAYGQISNRLKKIDSQSERPFGFYCFQRAVRVIYNNFLFPMIASFLIVLSVAGYVNNRRLPSKSDISISMLDALSMLLAWFSMGAVGFIEFSFIKRYSSLQGEKDVKKWYVPCLLIRSLIIIFLILIGIPSSLSKTLYAIIVVQVLYILLILFGRAYESVFQTVGVLLCQFSVLYALFLAFVRYFVTPREQIEVFLIIILEGLLILSILFTLLRVIKVIWTDVIVKILKKSALSEENSVQVQLNHPEANQDLFYKEPKRRMLPEGHKEILDIFLEENPVNLMRRLDRDSSGPENEHLTSIKKILKNSLIVQKKSKVQSLKK